MARLLVQYLTIYNNESLPNSKHIAKVSSKNCQILNKPTKIGKILPNLVSLIFLQTNRKGEIKEVESLEHQSSFSSFEMGSDI